MEIFRLFGTISLDKAGAISDMKSVEKQATGFGTRMGKIFAGIAATFATVFAVGKVKAFVDDALSEFKRFQKGMDEVFTLLPNITDPEKNQMMKDIRDLSEQLGLLTTETVPALYQAISAGVPEDNVFSFMETAGKSAIGGASDLETAVDGLTSAVNAYNDLDVGTAADDMFTAVRLGKTTFGELADSMSTITSIAATLKVDFGDVMAAVAQLTGEGMSTPTAMTYLRQLVAEIAQNGTDASKALKEMSGMSLEEFASSGHDLGEALGLIAKNADDSGKSLLDMFGRVQGGQAAMMLTGDHMDDFREKLDDMKDSAGAADKAYGDMTHNIQYELNKLASWWQGVKLDVGAQLQKPMEEFLSWLKSHEEEIGGAITKTFEALSTSLEWIFDHSDAVKKGIEAIGAALVVLVAIKTAGWAADTLKGLSSLGSALAATGPIGLAITGFSAAVLTIATRLQDAKKAAEEFKSFQEGYWEDLASKSDTLADSYHILRTELETEIGTEGTDALMKALDDLRSKVVDVPTDEMDKAWNDGIDTIVEAFKKKLPKISGLLDDFKPVLKKQGTDLMASLRQGIEESDEDFQKAVQDVIDKGLSGVTVPALDMGGAGQEIVDKFSEGFAKAATEADFGDTFGGLSMSDVGGSWFDAGKMAVKKFGDGIASAKAFVTSAMAGLFTSADAELLGQSAGTSYSMGFATATSSGGGLAAGTLPGVTNTYSVSGVPSSGLGIVPTVTPTQKKNMSFIADWFVNISKEGKATATTLTTSVASAIGNAFKRIAEAGLSSLTQEKEYQSAKDAIHQRALSNIAEAERARDDELEKLKQQLADKLITEDDYNKKHQDIIDKYNASVEGAHEKEKESLAEEEKAYKETKRGIGEILKDALKMVVDELAQELYAKAAAALATAIALSFALSPLAGAKYAESAAYTAGAVGMTAFETLALAEGGVFQKPTVLQNVPVAEKGYKEAFLPLNAKVYKEIGQGIAAVSPQHTIQVDMRGLYDGATINVRSDQDIKKIARETYTLYKDRLRGLGRKV